MIRSNNQSKTYLIREGALRAFLVDSYTFGLIGFLLYANHAWLGDHGGVAFLLVIMAISSIIGRNKSRLKRFDSLEDLQEFLKKDLTK